MYLLLNNNKYLDQIANSLYYCLKSNNINCKMVAEIKIPEKKIDLIAKVKESNPEKEVKNNMFDLESFKNFENQDPKNIMSSLLTNPKKNLSNFNKKMPNSVNPKTKSIFDIAENDKSDINEFKKAGEQINLSQIAMKGPSKKDKEFNIEEHIKNLPKNKDNTQNVLPKTFDLSAIASESTGVANNYVSTVPKEKKNSPSKEINKKKDSKKKESKKTNLEKNKNKEEDNKETDKEDVYIIFNINSIDKKDLPDKFLVYNFEQLTTDRKWDYSFFLKCKNALLVLDYSLENIKIFSQRGIEAYHLPFGWCSILEPSYNLTKKNIDILFLGSINKNRLNTITDVSIKNSKSNIYIHNKCFRDEFEKVTCSSKVGINIHYYEGRTILELTRIIPFICAGVIVVSERSNDIFYDKIFNSIIKFCKKEEISSVVKEQVYKYDLSKAMKKKKKLKKKLNFEKIVKENIKIFEKFI